MTNKNSGIELLRALRKKADLTLEDIAYDIGCSASYLSKIESGERRPSKQVAQRLADFFSIPPHARDAFVSGLRSLVGEEARNEAAEQPASGKEAAVATTGPEHFDEIETYFTDMEHLRDFFGSQLTAPKLAKRVFSIYGVGGVGKTSLLRMFRLYALRQMVPVALAGDDEVTSVPKLLARWARDLQATGAQMPQFHESYRRYLELESRRISELPDQGDWVDLFSPTDLDLVRNTADILTEQFFSDLMGAGAKRIVLMIDTFEKMSASIAWLSKLAQRLDDRVFLVVSGRVDLNWNKGWKALWSNWLSHTEIQEAKAVSREVARDLVTRYYAVATQQNDKPDREQVEAIIRFARGLPMALTGAVELWVAYNFVAFEAVRPQVAADLVDQMLKGVSREMVPVLEAASSVRWFNKPILRRLLGRSDVDDLYDELRRFPFMRPHAKGFIVHDSVREIVDEYLLLSDPDKHHTLHTAALQYFSTRPSDLNVQDAQQYELESLYHSFRVQEELGAEMLETLGDQFARYRLIDRLRSLVNDTASYKLENVRSRWWRDFYHAQLLFFDRQMDKAEACYRTLAVEASADIQLRVKVLLSWAELATRFERAVSPDRVRQAEWVLNECERLLSPQHESWTLLLFQRARLYMRHLHTHLQGRKLLEEIVSRSKVRNETYELSRAYAELKVCYVNEGDWAEVLRVEKDAFSSFGGADEQLWARFLSNWKAAWCWMGRQREAELDLRQVVQLEKKTGGSDHNWQGKVIEIPRDMLLAIGLQDRWDEVLGYFDDHSKYYRAQGTDYATGLGWYLGFWGIVCTASGGPERARYLLVEALAISEEKQLDQSMMWSYHLAVCSLVDGLPEQALIHLDFCLGIHETDRVQIGRHYFVCASYVGKVIASYLDGRFSVARQEAEVAEALAAKYHYNDQLSLLELVRGHAAWDQEVAMNMENKDHTSDIVLHHYKRALTYALRYNRLLLDRLLSGTSSSKQQPHSVNGLTPIISLCQAHGEPGKQVLAQLSSWWDDAINLLPEEVDPERALGQQVDVAAVSPITVAIPMREAETVARHTDPGDGSAQLTVYEQLAAALQQW